jgi:hypothetical protein
LAKLAPWAPAAVVQLVREMMSRDPLRRPQTPREVAERLMAMEIRALAELTEERMTNVEIRMTKE